MTVKPDLEVLFRVTRHPSAKGFLIPCSLSGGEKLTALLDTGATCSVISSYVVPRNSIVPGGAIPIVVANGEIKICSGLVNVVVEVGTKTITRKCFVMETDAFELVLGMDFVREECGGILLNPDRLIINGEAIPVTPQGASFVSHNFRMFKTEAYQLLPSLKSDSIRELAILPSELNPTCSPPLTPNPVAWGESFIVSSCEVDLFASLKNRNEKLFCCVQNSAWSYDWKQLGLTWANPPFSQIHQVLTKVALEETDMVLLTPDWGRSKMDQKWCTLLAKLTVRQVTLPNDSPLYIPENATSPLPKPRWGSTVSFISGRIRPVPREELCPRIVKSLLKKNCGRGREELDEWIHKNIPTFTAPEGTLCVPSPEPDPTPVSVKPWDEVSLPCSSIAVESAILDPHVLRNDQSMLAFYVDTLYEEVDFWLHDGTRRRGAT